MSFKREGDDAALLKNLNHQRVRELLGNHIPEDEAKLLSNGRLTCTICLHRPIFDTINMLASHRRGKRHLFELSKYIKCKEDAVAKDLQRKHLRLPLTDDIAGRNDLANKVSHSKLPMYLQQHKFLGFKCAESKQIAFDSKRRPVLEIHSSPSKLQNVTKPRLHADGKSACATVRQYLKNISRKSSLEKLVEKKRENYGLEKSSPQEKISQSDKKVVQSGAQISNPETLPNAKEQDQELKLRMSGWIKDLSGKWIKDPNVEFDSDEEETPPLT